MSKILTALTTLVVALAIAPASFGQVCADCGGDGGGGGGGGGNTAPTAAFSFGPSNAFTQQDVTFSNESTDDSGFTSAWDFGDGTNSADKNPVHQFAHAGTYNVQLTVTDAGSLYSSVTHQVTITNRAPTAAFTTAGVVQPGDDIGLTNSSSDQDGTVTSYLWEFSDNTSSTDAIPAKSFSTPGNYLVTLTAYDNNGSYSTLTRGVRVNAAPTALILVGSDQTAGQEVQFDSSAQDSDGTVDAYAWDFGDGSQGSGGTPAHTYAQAGDYTVKLTVTDNDGGNNSTQTVVHVAAPQSGGGDQNGGGDNTGGSGTTGGSGGGASGGSTSGTSTGSGSAGASGGSTQGAPSADAADKTAPVITVPAKLKAKKKTGKLTLAITSNEAVTVTAILTGKVKGSATAKVNGKGKIVIRLSSKAKKALKAAKVVKLTLVTTATDAAGNKTTKTTKVQLV